MDLIQTARQRPGPHIRQGAFVSCQTNLGGAAFTAMCDGYGDDHVSPSA